LTVLAIFGCIFDILGIFTIGFVFVPLAALCALFGLLSGIAKGQFSTGVLSILGGVLACVGWAMSPSLWLLTAFLMVPPAHKDEPRKSIVNAAPVATPPAVPPVPLPPRTPDDIMAPEGLPVLELADLLAEVLPADGSDKLDWDYMTNNPLISWKSEGIENHGGEATFRTGIVRVAVSGTFSQVLKRKWQDLAWTITLETLEPAKFGPKYITIQPNDGRCFGADYRGCNFSDTQVLSSPKLESHLLCVPRDSTDVIKVYSVSTSGGKPSLLVYDQSGGSGGITTSLEIRPLTDQPNVCKTQGHPQPSPDVVSTPSFVMPSNSDTLPHSGPRALCQMPDVIRNIMKAMGEVAVIKNAKLSVYDFKNSTTSAVNLKAQTFSCHGIVQITNGQQLPGTFSVSKNSAGDSVWRWMNDDRREPPH
jgi:hypothetical protein